MQKSYDNGRFSYSGLQEQVIGNIMYTRAKLADETGKVKEILTFGPVCIKPEYQRRGGPVTEPVHRDQMIRIPPEKRV